MSQSAGPFEAYGMYGVSLWDRGCTRETYGKYVLVTGRHLAVDRRLGITAEP